MDKPKYENGENEKSDRPTDFAHLMAWLAVGIGRDLTVEETDLSNILCCLDEFPTNIQQYYKKLRNEQKFYKLVIVRSLP